MRGNMADLLAHNMYVGLTRPIQSRTVTGGLISQAEFVYQSETPFFASYRCNASRSLLSQSCM